MLFTAAIMLCLKDEPHNYQNCQVVNSLYKYPTEEACWIAVNERLKALTEYPALGQIYEPVGAKCYDWLPTEEKHGT